MTEFWVNFVRYRTRAEAYKRIDQIDINRIRTNAVDILGEEYTAKVSDEQLRQEIKNIADIIYSDTLEQSSTGVCITDVGEDRFIFAGGWVAGGETPSDEFDVIARLRELGMDEDFEKPSPTYRNALSS